MPDNILIDVRNVTKRYGRRRHVDALRDVTVAIERGCVTAVVGPNGAGKSTFFGVILGFLNATSGDVSIDDLHPRDYVTDQGIGYLPDRFNLPARWPAGRAFDALATMNGLSASRAESAFSAFGLDEYRTRKTGELSRGVLQRLGLAHAFAADRDLLVLDEPAEGLDPVWRVTLRDRIAEQRTAGRTVLLASHDLAEVERIADTVIVLERGAVREVLDMRALRDAASPTYFRITLQHESTAMMQVFADAEIVTPLEYRVAVISITDFNRRLAALIELGGEITSAVAETEPLEERVRRTITP